MSETVVKDLLGNISFINMGQSPDSIYYNEDGIGLPLIQGNADIKERKSIKRFWTTQITKVCDKGDIIMTVRAPVGYIGVASFQSCVGRGVCSIKANDIDSKYLFYLLVLNEDNWKAFEAGTTFSAVTSKEVLNFPLFLTKSKPEQQKIAKILSTADAVIEKTKAAITKYKAIKQGMLHDLFTRGIDMSPMSPTNSEPCYKLRPRYEDAPHLYKKSKLGMIPKEWDEIPLEELTTQIGDGIHTTPIYSQNTHFYFINGNNLVNGEIQIGSALCVNEHEFSKHVKKLDERTILYSINGTIGNIALFKNELVVLGKSICYISCKQDVNLNYIFFLLQTIHVSRFYELELTASTIRNLSLSSVRNTPIVIPKNKQEQALIGEKINAIENNLQTEQSYLLKMQLLKKGLMEDLLSGKKQVI